MKLAGLAFLMTWSFVWPAAADEPRTNVETPAEALQKVRSDLRTTADDGASFGGGLWLTDEGEDDLVEPLPLGTRREFEDRGYEVVVEGTRIEYVVDKAGRIYHDRNYQGIIPGIRNWLYPRRQQRLRNRHLICWVGFQPMAAITRVFFHFSHPNPQFEVNKRDRLSVEVYLPTDRIKLRNHGRAMYAEKFRGAIETIRRTRSRRGNRFIITLKKPTNFLYRFESPFLFIDFEN